MKITIQFTVALILSGIVGYLVANSIFGFGGGCDGGLCTIPILFALGLALVLFVFFIIIWSIFFLMRRRRKN